MLCQSCRKNQATTHVKSSVNGKFTEYMLCSECAEKMGYHSIFEPLSMNLDHFLGSLFSGNTAKQISSHVLRCKRCGSSLMDISDTGKVGCADCYHTFYHQLIPSVRRIHGNTTHVGKVAFCAGKEAKEENKLEQMRLELSKAIQDQEFERAAELRDQIKLLEERNGNNG